MFSVRQEQHFFSYFKPVSDVFFAVLFSVAVCKQVCLSGHRIRGVPLLLIKCLEGS